MIGRVYSIGEFHYIHGLLHFLLRHGASSLDTCVANVAEIAKSGKSTSDRVKNLAQLAQDFGLVAINNDVFSLTELGLRYVALAQPNIWAMTGHQAELLTEQILLLASVQPSVFALVRMLQLVAEHDAGVTVARIRDSFAVAVNRPNWNDRSRRDFARFILAFLREIGLTGENDSQQFSISDAGKRLLQRLASSAYVEPPLEAICATVKGQGVAVPLPVIRRYHLSLKTQGFVVLSGRGVRPIEFAEAYAKAVGARVLALKDEDPQTSIPKDPANAAMSASSLLIDFAKEAQAAHRVAQQAGMSSPPYHVVFDGIHNLNLSASLSQVLSVIQLRSFSGQSNLQLEPGQQVLVPPNLVFIGTMVEGDAPAPVVCDVAQVIELGVSRNEVSDALESVAYRQPLLEIWDAVCEVAPLEFGALAQIKTYIEAADSMGVTWEEALDEQLLQMVLPKIRGNDSRIKVMLDEVIELTRDRFPLSYRKAVQIRNRYSHAGYASFF